MTKNQASEVKIDARSVNSVALEPEPQSEFQRILVAATSIFSTESKKVVARETCMIPVIPGLPGLICLTFSPVCELRCDEKKGLFLGTLCGLGAELLQGHLLPYDPDNDIELPFDVVFTRRDLADINSIRYRVSMMLDDGMKGRFELAGNPLFQRQQQLRASVLSLIQRRRLRLPPQRLPFFDYKWLCPPQALVPGLQRRNLFLPVIHVPKFETGEFFTRAENELDLFRNLTPEDFSRQAVVCPLDNKTLRCMEDLLEHRSSKDHMTRNMELIHQREDENWAAQQDRIKRADRVPGAQPSQSGDEEDMDQS